MIFTHNTINISRRKMMRFMKFRFASSAALRNLCQSGIYWESSLRDNNRLNPSSYETRVLLQWFIYYTSEQLHGNFALKDGINYTVEIYETRIQAVAINLSPSQLRWRKEDCELMRWKNNEKNDCQQKYYYSTVIIIIIIRFDERREKKKKK